MSKEAADELRAMEMKVRAGMDAWLDALAKGDPQRHELWNAADAAAKELNARKNELDPAP